jgi:hypothetical protein
VLLIVGVIGGRAYWPAAGPADQAPAPASTSRTPASAPVKVTLPNAAAETGRLEIETQPAGARVLLDGKAAGESPLTIDSVPVGRHTITFVSGSGSVKRTIRVEAGRTTKLDVPIFSGWVGIFAPFVLEVIEGTRTIGTTEEPRIMLSPGRHVLTLQNRELGYSTVQAVDIEPGEVRSITLDPRGVGNLNATPWAEVWLDGKKLGDTPIANLAIPLGTRELTFRHPQLGDRRMTVVVKATSPLTLSVDMTKP